MKPSKDEIAGSSVLNQTLNAILALSVRAFTVRIRKENRFNGHPVANYPAGNEEYICHTLTREEQAPQDLVKVLWDRQER
jgi:hypothetical protein